MQGINKSVKNRELQISQYNEEMKYIKQEITKAKQGMQDNENYLQTIEADEANQENWKETRYITIQ